MTRAILSLVLLFSTHASSSSWKKLSPKAPWSGRSDPQLVLLGEQLLLLGGHNGTSESSYFNDVWSSGDGGLSWDLLLEHAPWAGRSYHMAKRMAGKVYLMGGHDKDTWYNDVWSTSDGKNWKLVTKHAEWSPRAAAALQVRRGRMFVMGGSDGLLKPIGNGTVRNDVWVSDDSGKSWSQTIASAPWPAREGLQKLTALYGEEEMIILTAGEAGYSGPYFNDVWGTTDGTNWKQLAAKAGFSARSGNLLLNLGGALYTFGGYGVPMKHDGYCLPAGSPSFSDSDWVKLGEAPWHGRFDYDMEVVNGSIVLLAGEASLFGAGGPYFNDVWQLQLPGCSSLDYV